jgi:hypothetical protein
MGDQPIKTSSERRIDRRCSRQLHAIVAVAIALATILSAVSTTRAQVGTVASVTGVKKHPVVEVAPKKVDFQKFHVGMTSPPHGVAFTNKSAVDLPAPSVAVSGTGFS